MKISEVIHCSFNTWYPEFTHITIESVMIPLPSGFVQYLLEDGIVLPESEEPKKQLAGSASESSSDNEVDWEDSDAITVEAPKFEEFDQKIKHNIEKLGGKVFPKLNWSSPRDASWINWNNSCCCCTISDVYLLLKSSHLIAHDLVAAFATCEDHSEEDMQNSDPRLSQREIIPYYLILRKWTEIDPSTEYRCFVKENVLVGISQRDQCTNFDHIRIQKEDIVKDISSFFEKHLKCKFPCCNYVFDIFRKNKGEVFLIDFNPFGTVTDSLLFDWVELEKENFNIEKDMPEFRYVDKSCGFQPRPFSQYSVPTDIIDISNGTDSFKFYDLLKLKMEDQANRSSSEEES